MLGNKYNLGSKHTQKHKDNSSKGHMITISSPIKSILEIIEGLVLTDAHLSEPKTEFQNSRFQISIGWKFRPFAYYLQQLFSDHNIDTTMKTYTRKTGITSINLTTTRNTNFTKLHKKWYKNGIKIIPDDLEITPKSLAYIMMGDGYSRYTYKDKIVIIGLCTENFTIKENELLAKKIFKLGVTFRVCKHRKSVRLICKRKSDVSRFMGLIEPHMLDCFRYKIKYPIISDIHHPLRTSKMA